MKNRLSIRALANSSVVSAISSIELFNRPRAEDRISLSMIANVRAWEQLGKAVLLRKGEDIIVDTGKSIPASKVLRLLDSKYGLISPGANETVQQIISLRDEATHSDLNDVPDDISAHLLYFSLKSFKELLIRYFPSIGKRINANFISVNFEPTYTFGQRINKLLKYRKSIIDNRLIYLLERGLQRTKSEGEYSEGEWIKDIRSLKGKRITKATLQIKKYVTDHDSVQFITVEAPSKYGHAEITLSESGKGYKLTKSISYSDPEKSHPYLTRDLAEKISTTKHIVIQVIKKLDLKGKKEYHLAIRSSNKGYIQRYSELALEVIRNYYQNNWGKHES